MIVYQATKVQFLDDVLTNNIENIVLDAFIKKLNKSTGQREIHSWKESLQYMDRVLQDYQIPDDCGVAIEYQIPPTSKRIDFILTGQNEKSIDYAILIELKQWEEAEITDKDAIVRTYVGRGINELTHPSYQAWTYSTLLQGFNEAVYNENIQLKPCAYLHNYIEDNKITSEVYREYIEKAPLFLKGDAVKLRDFIKKFVKYGDKSNIIFKIEQGKIKPSKTLADSMVSMLKGNKEFIMIDDQKLAYENALSLAKKSSSNDKNVLIVRGGPGTGKSVIAVNLLVELTKLGLVAQYVSKNAAPRTVYESKLTGSLRPTVIRNFFNGSGQFIKAEKNIFDALIVDEAHRLNEKSGLYGNLGDNQIKEIINSAKFSVFFIDEDQRVTLKDIGREEEIINWAKWVGAKVHPVMELASQFRCNGSEGYLAWLDNILQIKETANSTFDDFDFQIIDTPNELRDIIFEKNKVDNKARMVAGYCWNWVSKRRAELYDIVIPQYNFKIRWNLTSDGSLWIINKESVKEIGCIHTCQGLEVDYIGVIVGGDLKIREGEVITNPALRAITDKSLSGYKRVIERDPEGGRLLVDQIIKNTYRTLMTRGMKGCYVYFTDKPTADYFKCQL